MGIYQVSSDVKVPVPVEMKLVYYLSLTLLLLVTLTSPSNFAENVNVQSDFSITFSEPIAAGTNNIILSKLDGNSVETFPPNSPALTISENSLTIDPTADLDEASSYKFELQEDSVLGLTGKSYSGTDYVIYTSNFDSSVGATLEIRNVVIKEDSVEYDLYFVYDSSYVIQTGKVLGIRIHEYMNTEPSIHFKARV